MVNPKPAHSKYRPFFFLGNKKKKGILELLLITLLCLGFVVFVFGVVRPFVLKPFYLASGSMVPTLLVGDRVLAEQFTYRFFFAQPQRGDIVLVEKGFAGVEEEFVKRVVGLEGDKIELNKDGVLLVNDEPQQEPYFSNKEAVVVVVEEGQEEAHNERFYGPVVVPEAHVFVLGDNRDYSLDSRHFGPIPEEKLEGEVFLRYWPLSRMGLLS